MSAMRRYQANAARTLARLLDEAEARAEAAEALLERTVQERDMWKAAAHATMDEHPNEEPTDAAH